MGCGIAGSSKWIAVKLTGYWKAGAELLAKCQHGCSFSPLNYKPDPNNSDSAGLAGSSLSWWETWLKASRLRMTNKYSVDWFSVSSGYCFCGLSRSGLMTLLFCFFSPLFLKDQVSKDKALQSMASMSSAQIVSASVLQNKLSPPPPIPQAVFSAPTRVRNASTCSCLFLESNPYISISGFYYGRWYWGGISRDSSKMQIVWLYNSH